MKGCLTCMSPGLIGNCPCAGVPSGCRDVRSRLTRMEKMLDMMQLGEFKLQEVTRKVRSVLLPVGAAAGRHAELLHRTSSRGT